MLATGCMLDPHSYNANGPKTHLELTEERQ
jgi:hypothetical protein